MNTFTFPFETESGEVQITYRVSPYLPATYGQPAEGGDVEITEASGLLTDAEEEEAGAIALRRAPKDVADWAADYGEYLRDQRNDARMMELLSGLLRDFRTMAKLNIHD